MILIPGPQYVAPALRTSETKEADATVRTTCVTGVILESHTLHPANSMCMSVLHSCLTLCDPMVVWSWPCLLFSGRSIFSLLPGEPSKLGCKSWVLMSLAGTTLPHMMSGACRQKPSTPPRNRWNTAEQLSYQPDPTGLGVLVIPGTIIALLGSASHNSRGCPSHAEHCSHLSLSHFVSF